ncbi:hypothetical protein ACHAW6_001982 [Cyclotella cf. meneghiniana]
MGNSSTKSHPKSSDANMKTLYFRRSHHAGSWYDDDPRALDDMLSMFLADASENKCSSDAYETESTTDSENNVVSNNRRLGVPRACISPHAGFQYSGPTAAYSFLALKEALLSNPLLQTVVVLHPSHHVYLDGCALSGAQVLQTPLRNLQVDDDLREQLLSTGKFTTMKQGVDEREHSGEMQYPFIAKVINDLEQNMSEHDKIIVKVLPIMVGSLKRAKEETFGKLLSSFLSDHRIFTVISSDFCHWGERFGYTPQPSRDTNVSINEVHEYIEYLDRKGMDLIAMQRPGAFADYLREYSNTICGRHPIAVWLNSVTTNKEEGKETLDVRFVKYAQSGKAVTTKDFSVSYASAVARLFSSDP